MQILILNGSPKGERSVSLKTAEYLQKLYPEHRFDVLHAGAKTAALEKDFTPAKDAVEKADLILAVYPVYTFLAPAQLHRFFELMREKGVRLDGKKASQITTSKHFYDTTAHAYVSLCLQDFGAEVYEGLSADMDDLLKEEGRRAARSYFDTLLFRMERRMHLPKRTAGAPDAENARRKETYTAGAAPVPKSSRYTAAMILCASPEDTSVLAMADDFEAAFAYEVRRFNMYDFPFRGGCLGCLQCAPDGECIYTDGFQQMLREQINVCDAFIYAFPIRNHYTYAQLKMFDDRQFCNGHRTVNAGTPVGYIVDGNLGEEENLRTLIQARAAVGENFLCGTAGSGADPRREIENLASMTAFALENRTAPAENFYGAGGSRIFRDLVYEMQGIMQADHRFFKEHGLYDSFPQNHRKAVWFGKMVGGLLKMPKAGAEVRKNMDRYMLSPYEKVLEAAKAAEENR